MTKKRIVVTGMGIVSSFGSDVEHFYQQLLAGVSGIVPIEEFPCADWPTRIAGVIAISIPAIIWKKNRRVASTLLSDIRWSPEKKALEHGNLRAEDLSKLDKSRCGIVIGSGMGGMSVFHDGVETLLTKSYRRLTPFFVPYIITNMAGALLAIDVGFMGPNFPSRLHALRPITVSTPPPNRFCKEKPISCSAEERRLPSPQSGLPDLSQSRLFRPAMMSLQKRLGLGIAPEMVLSWAKVREFFCWKRSSTPRARSSDLCRILRRGRQLRCPPYD